MNKAISGMIFTKCLKFKKKALAEATPGKIVTIAGPELLNMEDGLVLTPYIIISPLSTIFAFSLIAINFKEAALLGLIVYCILVILQILISKVTVKWKYLESFYSDKRVKIISDAINGIRTIKWYGWEVPYKELIQKWRK